MSEYDVPLDESIDRENEAAALLRENELIQLRAILDTANGRKAIWRMLTRMRAFSTPFVAGNPDVTAFQCGEQNVGLWLLGEVTAAGVQYYPLMQEENAE